MELSNEFVVPVPVDEAWKLLTDVERIAPCMPGAELTEIDGEEYRGVVKVKVGPITAQYKGKAHVRREGRRRPQGGAAGRRAGTPGARATPTPPSRPRSSSEGGGTRVKVVTDLAITGRAAQFGRGVMADVSTKLLGQFVDCLEKNVLGAGAGAAAAAEPEAAAPAAEAAPVGEAAPETRRRRPRSARAERRRPAAVAPRPSGPGDPRAGRGQRRRPGRWHQRQQRVEVGGGGLYRLLRSPAGRLPPGGARRPPRHRRLARSSSGSSRRSSVRSWPS